MELCVLSIQARYWDGLNVGWRMVMCPGELLAFSSPYCIEPSTEMLGIKATSLPRLILFFIVFAPEIQIH
jgi:hypothetical protein